MTPGIGADHGDAVGADDFLEGVHDGLSQQGEVGWGQWGAASAGPSRS